MIVLFVRNNRVLINHDSIPSIVPNELLVINSYVVGEITVVTSWTGTLPNEWTLVPIHSVQTANPDLSDEIGAALLDPRCAI